MRRFSATAKTADGKVYCARCDAQLGSVSDWKRNLPCTSVAAASIPGAGAQTRPDLVLRQFACRNCGSLIDTEMALPADPLLKDSC